MAAELRHEVKAIPKSGEKCVRGLDQTKQNKTKRHLIHHQKETSYYGGYDLNDWWGIHLKKGYIHKVVFIFGEVPPQKIFFIKYSNDLGIFLPNLICMYAKEAIKRETMP